jgi:copper chaperone CopZ
MPQNDSNSTHVPLRVLPIPLQAAYAIGGMTCAACSGTITRALTGVDGLSHIAVNLMTHSLTLHAEDVGDVQKVVGLVEDLGYDCTFVNSYPLSTLGEQGRRPEKVEERTVKIEVELSGCPYCSFPLHLVAKSLSFIFKLLSQNHHEGFERVAEDPSYRYSQTTNRYEYPVARSLIQTRPSLLHSTEYSHESFFIFLSTPPQR